MLLEGYALGIDFLKSFFRWLLLLLLLALQIWGVKKKLP
jgi:hypothetical protein